MQTVLEFLSSLAAKGVKLSLDGEQLNCYAQHGVLTEELRSDIVRHRPQIALLLKERQQARQPAGLPPFALSAGGQGLYILQQLEPASSAYNVPLCFRSRAGVQLQQLQQAWQLVQQQFPILTARIVQQGGRLLHELDASRRTSLRAEEVGIADDAAYMAFLRGRARLPFDLDQGPLTRAAVYLRPGRDATLLITIHHIVVDGISSVILLKTLFAHYLQLCMGRPASPAAASSGYRDFVAWEQALLAGPEGQAHAGYWRRQLEGAPPSLELPPPAQAADSAAPATGLLVQALDAEVSRAVQALSRAHAVPPSAIFLAAYQLLLHRHSGQEDIVVTMPVMGRAGGRFRNDVGYFVNMVPLRSRYADAQAFTAWLRQTQATMMDALYHAAYPFPLIVQDLKLTGARADTVFRIAYAYQNVLRLQDVTAADGRALDVEMVAEVSQEGAADLGLEIFEDGSNYALHLKHALRVLDAGSARRLLDQLHTLLGGAVAEPGSQLHRLPLIDAQERQRVLETFNATQAAYAQDVCIHECFEAQAASVPGQPAASFRDQTLSYAQLHARCSDLALVLQSMGIAADSLVGLYMERSLELMTGLMGTLMAGGAYVPLDPDYPQDRLAYMLQDTQAPVVLTQARLLEQLRTLVGPSTVLVALDEEWPRIEQQAAAARRDQVALRKLARPDSLAYVIYTSGSTGRPKGVMVEHQALMNRIQWMQKCYPLGAGDVVLQKTPYSFDVSVWEFVWPMMSGAAVVFAEPGGHMDVAYLQGLINQAGVSTLHYVPSMLRAFLENAQGNCPGVRQIFCSGEALDWRSASHYRERFPNAALHNLYGPTEAAIDVTAYTCDELPALFVPIGAPIDNTQIHILDQHNQLQPIGVPGELHIAGHGLARGYLNRPELTQEKFVANPFEPGRRMYKTGDLARWLPDGNIQYLGRIDTQVKIRGFRIELGEIEVRLNQHPLVEDSVVIARGADADKRLLAFYRAKGTVAGQVHSLDPEQLRAHLQRSLPAYMTPAAFVSIEQIPLTPSGKADRKALERIEVALQSQHSYVAPATATQASLARLWAEVLGVPQDGVGALDGFFDLGGHSLLATQLLSRLRQEFGVELPLKTLFDQPTLAAMAAALDQALQAGKGQRRMAPIAPADRTRLASLPLSFAQERLWFLDQLDPGSAGYNCPGAVRISGPLDADLLERAFNQLIARHETLRTVFPSADGRAQQLVLERLDFRLQRTDLQAEASPAAREAQARQLCHAEAATAFDLARGPLLRGQLMRLQADEHVLMLNMHHIVSDGWSLGVLVRELQQIIEAQRLGRQPSLPALPIQYADYGLWQRQWLEEEGELQRQLAYWTGKLAGMPELLELTTDHARPAIQSFAGAVQGFSLDAQLSTSLQALAEQQGCTLFMLLLTAFKALLYRSTGQADLCVGSPIANRRHAETEGLIGMFVNTLALRTQVDAQDSALSLLSRVRATCLEAYEHQDAPFEKVVEAVKPQRTMAMSSIFQVMLSLQNADSTLASSTVQNFPLQLGVSKFDLSLDFTASAQGLEGGLEYCTALFRPVTAARLVRHFEALCRALVAAPSARLADLDFIGVQERQLLLAGFNDTAQAYPQDLCIHEVLARQAQQCPGRTAVEFGQQRLSYGELQQRSRALALHLQSLGVCPEQLVGLCMERSLDMLVGLLAILQAGGAYLPLDPTYPDERLAFMLEDSRARTVLTQASLLGRLQGLGTATRQCIALDVQWHEVQAQAAVLQARGNVLRSDVVPTNLAYVIYTSGSTGRPKGVMITHRSLVNQVTGLGRRYGLGERDRVLQFAPLSFDMSVEEIFCALGFGATLVLREEHWTDDVQTFLAQCRRHAITVCNLPTRFWELLVQAPLEIPACMRQIAIGGEGVGQAATAAWLQRTGHRPVLVNAYGPTEATVNVCVVQDLSDANDWRSIGRPLANTRVYILDARLGLQPIGVPGELCVAGEGVARGYLHREELTAEKFVHNPFEPGQRMYRTGDLARWLDDGSLEYRGRIDTQVKVRGFRIETGEIEARLNEHPAISDCVVVVQGQDGDKRLVAFYRTREPESQAGPDVAQLRTHLQDTLPAYMTPSAFVCIEQIPLTPNGKVDRRALERREVSLQSGQAYVAPGTDTQLRLAQLWAQLLGLPQGKVGLRDGFFDLGGHSLLATQLLSRLRAEFEVELPLRTLFEQPTLAGMAAAVEQARQAGAGLRRLTPITAVDRSAMTLLPLSFAQERLWFIDQLEPGNVGYNCPAAVRISGALDVEQLEQAFNQLIARHETLRTVFPSEEGQARQRILEHLALRLQRIDLSAEGSPAARVARARQLCQAEAATAFDLARGPLLRGHVIRLQPDEHIVMLNMHHIVSDGWSQTVLIRELGSLLQALRTGRPAQLPALPIQYADYALWQRRWLEEQGELQRQLAYWTQQLAGAPERLELPSDRPRPAVQDFAGAVQGFTLDAQLSARLQALAEQQGCTLFMLLLAVFKTLLYRTTGQSDLCVGSPIANRRHAETEGLIGMFVNTLVLRTQVDPQDSLLSLLSKVRATCLQAYEHQDTPFEKLVDALHVRRDMAVSPLFQVMLVLQNGAEEAPQGDIQPFALEGRISKFDLTLELTPTRAGLVGTVEYRTALFERASIERLTAHYTALCKALVASPSGRLIDCDYLGQAELEQLLVRFNRARPGPEQSFEAAFSQQAALRPAQVAVELGGQQWSYAELESRSRALAAWLQRRGIGAGSIVGLCLPRSLELMVGLLGIVRAGAAYLPLDPEYPDERLAYMLQDSSPVLVLTQACLHDKLARLAGSGLPLLSLDQEWPETAQAAAPPPQAGPDDWAYVIYTSGSTGRPKGAAVYRRGLANLLQWYLQATELTAADHFLVVTSTSFDLTQKNLLAPLMCGAAVHLGPEPFDPVQLSAVIQAQRISVMNLTPSAFYAIADADDGQALASLRQVVLGGEPISCARMAELQQRYPQLQVMNSYGPTECADVCAYHFLRPQDLQAQLIPIGRPVPQTRLYVLDAQRKPVPIGVSGEIHVGGIGVGAGYLNQPQLTAERFEADPYDNAPQARMYKTGDLGRWLADGSIQYLGRIDTQVKIRGFRIELGEIEARLNEHPQIEDSVVVEQVQDSDKRLVAFYRAQGTAAGALQELDATQLRTHLQETLPAYMTPSAFVSIEQIPLTPNGKVDRRALQQMQVQVASGRKHVAPRNDAEARLAALWAAVLRLEPGQVGIHDGFFELGGHSLLAVQLMARVGKEFGRSLPLAAIFEHADIAAMAAALCSGPDARWEVLVPIQPRGAGRPVFVVPGAGGQVLSFAPLGRALDQLMDRAGQPGLPVHALQAPGLDGVSAPLASVEQTAAVYIRALRAVQAHGPYRLVGHSYGGVVAYEMARQLLDVGEPVSALVLVDALAPAVMQSETREDSLAPMLEMQAAIERLHPGQPLQLDHAALREATLQGRGALIAQALQAAGLEVDVRQLTAFLQVFEAHVACYAAYRPGQLAQDIPAALFRARELPTGAPKRPSDHGWGPLLPRTLHVAQVAGNHLSMLDQEHAMELASHIAASLGELPLQQPLPTLMTG